MKAQTPIYTIQSMPAKEIVECLSESGFNILVTDITQPSPAYILRLYEGILGVFLDQRVPENLDESTTLVIIYVYMKRVLERIGLGMFYIRDIIAPEANRTIKILSALINFALFKESKKHLLTNIYRKREELETTIEETEKNIEKNEALLKQKREEKEEFSRQIKEISKEIAEKEAEIINYHRIQQGMAMEIEETAKEQMAVTDDINSEKSEISKMTQEITKLQARIVKNPEQLKELLIGMGSQISDETEILKEYERRVAALHSNMALFQRVSEDLKSLMCIVSLVGEYCSKCTELQSLLKRLESENSSLEIENKSKLAKKHLLDKKIAYVIEKIASLTEEDKLRMNGLKKEFEALREKHQKVSEQREHAQRMIQKNNEEIKELEKEIIQIESLHESRLSSVYNEFVQQRNFLIGYSEDIEKVFKGEYML